MVQLLGAGHRLRLISVVLALIGTGLLVSLLPTTDFTIRKTADPVKYAALAPVFPGSGVRQDLGVIVSPVVEARIWASARLGFAPVRINVSLLVSGSNSPVRQFVLYVAPAVEPQPQIVQFTSYKPPSDRRLTLQLAVVEDAPTFVTIGITRSTGDLALPTLNEDFTDAFGPVAHELTGRERGFHAALHGVGPEIVRLAGAGAAFALAIGTITLGSAAARAYRTLARPIRRRITQVMASAAGAESFALAIGTIILDSAAARAYRARTRPIREWISIHPDATAYLAFAFIVTFWFRGFIFDAGQFGLRDDWTVPPTDWQIIQAGGQHFSAWSSNTFGLPIFERPMSVYVNHFSGLLAYVFSVDGRLISKFPIALLFLAAVFMYQGCRTLGVRRQAAFVAALTYASTPFFFDSYVTGYLSLFIGLALFPKAFITVHEAFDKPPGFRRFLKGFVWIGLSASTIHMAFLLTAVLGGYAVLRMAVGPGLIRTRMRSALSVLVMSLGIALLHPPVATLLHGLLFVPGTREELTALAQSQAVTWIHAVAPAFFQSVLQIGPPYNYEQAALATISGASPIFMIGRALLVGLGIAAVAVARGRARLWAAFFAFVFIGFSLLGKGISEPLSISGFWLRELPGAEVFRNVRYFTVPAAMALAFLVGLSVHAWITSRSRLRPLASAGLGAVLIASSLGFWSGDLLGQLTPYDVAETTLEAHDRIRAMPDDSRLLNLPMSGPAVYLSDTGRSSASGDNPFVSWPAKPSIWVSPQPTVFPQYFSTLFHSLLDPARYSVRALLNFGRVGYVLFDPHWQTRYASFIVTHGEPWLSGYETSDRLTLASEQQTGLVDDSTLSQGPVRVARVEGVLGQRLSVPDRVALSSPSLRHLTTASFAFPSDRQITHLQGPYRRSPSANALASEIWLDADPLDAVIFFVPPQHIFEPGVQMGQNSSDATQEWVATYLNAWWYLNSEISDATSSILTKAPNSSFSMLLTSGAGDHELWIRHFTSPTGSSLSIDLNGQPLASISTAADDLYGYVWTRIPIPSLPAGQHTLNLITDAAGLNAVSQVVLAPVGVMRRARDLAGSSLLNLPLGLVLPDLENTNGNRRFSLPVAGSFRLDTLVPDTFAPALSIDGAPVRLTESPSSMPGKKRLQAQIQLEAGSHTLTLASASEDSPVTVEAVDSPFHSADAGLSCYSPPCSGAVRYIATGANDGRTVTFTGRLRVGKYQVLLQAFQADPKVLYSTNVHVPGQGTEDVRVTVRLDPGSSQATLDARQHLGTDAGLDFELLDIEQSALPHGISITLARGAPQSPPEAKLFPIGSDSPTSATGVYQGPPRRTIVRLDEKFDHRWVLTIDGEKVDPSDHILLDGHFNGWIVDLAPGSTVHAEFAVQKPYFGIQVVNLILLVLAALGASQPWRLLRRLRSPTS